MSMATFAVGIADAVTLTPVRLLKDAPVIVQPYRSELWHTTKRLRRCEIWCMPDDPRPEDIYDCCWWMPLYRRDVTLWPTDVWSSHIFTQITACMLQHWTPRERHTLAAVRWAWGHPFADELDLPAADIDTVYLSPSKSEQKAA